MRTLALAVVTGLAAAAPGQVVPVPEALRPRLDPFYQKYVAVDGLPIVSSARVPDAALREAAWILEHMAAGRQDLLPAMAARGVRVAVMAYDEFTTDLPEQRSLQPRVYWDRRARGLGGKVVSCGEENLLCYPGDPYARENLLIHEFAHAVHAIGMRALDSTFAPRLDRAYAAAMKGGLWKGTYAATNVGEYWAEGVQSWFDNNRENDVRHNRVDTRAELEVYDPALAKLCAEAFGAGGWRYRKPAARAPEGRTHLAGFDPSRAPRFHWRKAPMTARPRVWIATDLGRIEVELDHEHAPTTVENFLRYVDEGLYAGGAFFRTVTARNQPRDAVKIEVVQGRAGAKRRHDFLPPIALERTRDTGLRHVDGTVSMARSGPDTARDSFFICVGDQPELDFGGKRNPDGQGFAAFGRVVGGMDVVRKIHRAASEGQQLTPPIRILWAIRRS